MKKRIKAFLNRRYTKWLLKHRQYRFDFEEITLNYLFVPKKGTKRLIVVFSGMNQTKASYNYIGLLNFTKSNRLYILDDCGDAVLGCYYIGTNGNNRVELAVKALIEMIKKKTDASDMVFCGSSKGGYAALNFGIEYSDAVIIAGAPQYRLGFYLQHRKSPKLMKIIAGEHVSADYLGSLDMKIENKLAKNRDLFQGKIYLHYSNNEHTYKEHIQSLLCDFKKLNYKVIEDVRSYAEHDDVALFFPPFLEKTILELERV